MKLSGEQRNKIVKRLDYIEDHNLFDSHFIHDMQSLLASEQAFHKSTIKFHTLNIELIKDLEVEHKKLNQALEVLKQAHVSLLPTCIEKDNRLSCLCSSCVTILSIEQFLSSLSEESE